MEMEYIREFTVLAECMNYSEAASRLSMSQSALSKHIQSLERAAGGNLFMRTTRSIALSERGSAFLPYARKLVADYEDAEAILKEYDWRQRHSFPMGVHRNLQYFGIDAALIQFHKAYPDDTVSILEGDERKLAELFRQKKVNLYTGSELEAKRNQWNFLPIAQVQVCAMVRDDSPLARYKKIPLTRLREENILMPPAGSTPHAIIQAAFKRESVTPHIIYEGDSHGCADFVLAGMGVLLQLENIATGYLTGGLCLKRVSPEIPFRYGVIYRDRSRLSLPERHMMDFCKSVAE